jgi:hypothetical protein
LRRAALFLLCLHGGKALAVEPQCAASLNDVDALIGPRYGSAKSLRRDFDFAKHSVCLQHERAPRRVLLISLGEFQSPMAIGIEALARRDGVLAPEVRVLDQEGRELARHGFTAFRQRGKDFTHTVFFNDTAASRGYLLIGLDPDAIGSSGKLVSGNRYVAPIISPLVIGAYGNGFESQREIPFREAGLLRVQMESAQSRAVP